MSTVLEQVRDLQSVLRTKGDRFSIAIAQIENDTNGAHQRLIADALQGRFDDEIELLLLDRRIGVGNDDRPQDAVKAGHAHARVLLRDANANVMIWGQALDDKTSAPMRPHWTVNTETELRKSSEKYLPDQVNYDLPELFWSDLDDVLGLLVTSQAATISGQYGKYIADQLKPFIKRVSLLAASGGLSGEKQAQLQAILADALQIFGDQRGDTGATRKAVNTYREALTVLTRERAPLDWARTQNSLGNALRTLGERKGGTALLEEAVAALREALNEYERERVPLAWAATQHNLGNALQTRGDREGDMARLEQAVAAYHEASKQLTHERAPLALAVIQNNLSIALQTLGERERARLGWKRRWPRTGGR
jgi:tetratricopeptide (TPR) repeat protein